MPRDGTETRERIMDAAQALILGHGFAGTSVEAVIERAGVTKGAFFHHFPSKADLARALVERYAALDARLMEEVMDRAERLGRDPLQQVLIFVGLFEELVEELAEPYPGCLLASYCYEAQLFEADTLEVIGRAVEGWRQRLGAKLREAAALHPPRLEVDLDAVADMLFVVFEGAFVLARATEDPAAAAAQLRQYRNYLELLFGAVPAVAPAVSRAR